MLVELLLHLGLPVDDPLGELVALEAIAVKRRRRPLPQVHMPIVVVRLGGRHDVGEAAHGRLAVGGLREGRALGDDVPQLLLAMSWLGAQGKPMEWKPEAHKRTAPPNGCKQAAPPACFLKGDAQGFTCNRACFRLPYCSLIGLA